jgi:hypothetical protein
MLYCTNDKDVFARVEEWEALLHPAYSPGMSLPDAVSSQSIKNCCMVNDLSLDTWNAAVIQCSNSLTPAGSLVVYRNECVGLCLLESSCHWH